MAMTVSGTTPFAAGAAVAILLGLAFLARLQLAPSGLDPARDAVGAYGVGPYHWWYRGMVVAFGAGALLLAAALDRAGGVPTAGLALLAGYGVARIVIAAFPADRDGAAPTAGGRVHTLLAVLAFVAIAVAAPIVSGWLATFGDLPEVAEITRSVAVMVVVSCAVTLAAGLVASLRRWFGGFQRVFYVASQAWLLIVAAQLAVRGR
jgi:Protein of unknown function (DUF998)